MVGGELDVCFDEFSTSMTTSQKYRRKLVSRYSHHGKSFLPKLFRKKNEKRMRCKYRGVEEEGGK